MGISLHLHMAGPIGTCVETYTSPDFKKQGLQMR